MSGVFLQTYECFNLQPVPQQAYSPGCKLHIPTQLWKLVIAKVMQYSQEKKKLNFTGWCMVGRPGNIKQDYLQAATTTFCGDTFMCRIATKLEIW